MQNNKKLKFKPETQKNNFDPDFFCKKYFELFKNKPADLICLVLQVHDHRQRKRPAKLL